MLTFLSLHASSCKNNILLKPTNKRVVKCKGNILSNQMWGKSCSRNVLYHSYPKLTPVTQSRSHILRNKKIWIPDRLVKTERTMESLTVLYFLCALWSKVIIIDSLPTRFEQIPISGLLNCSIFVSLLYFQHWPENFENSEPLSLWISVMIWLITQFVQIPCQICLTSDLWAFSDVDPATTLSSSHWAIVHDRTILRGNYHNFRVYFKDWKNAFRQLELLLHEDL